MLVAENMTSSVNYQTSYYVQALDIIKYSST